MEITKPNQLSIIGSLVTMPEGNRAELFKRGISVEVVDLSRMEPEQRNQEITEVAQLYAKVFAGPEWNEVTWCSSEKRFYGNETAPGEMCSCGNCALREAYPVEQTEKEILDVTSRNDAVFMTVKNSERQTVGFAWGYSYPDVKSFVEEKYTDPNTRSQVYNALASCNITGTFFYIAECGIVPDAEGQSSYRGLSITNEFFQRFIQQAKALAIPVVMRTNDASRMNTVAQQFGMEQIFGPKVVVNERREIRTTAGIAVNGIDGENEQRVLYAIGV